MSLFTEAPLPEEITPPKDGPRYYGRYRWRKLINRTYYAGEMENLLKYWCRTGKWQGISLWVVKRKNLGTSYTSRQAYQEGDKWDWTCNGAETEQLQKLEVEVTYRIRMGVKAGLPEYLEIR